MNERVGAGAAAFWGDTDDASLQRYQTLVNTVDDGIYQLDAAGRFVGVNDTIVEITGYSREDLLGEHVSLVLDDDTGRIEQDFRERLEMGDDTDGITYETTVETAGGEHLTCEVQISLLISDGEFRGSVGVVRETTERHRHEHDRERVYQALETAGEGISLLDEDGEFVYVNQSYADIYRYDPGEMIGIHWEALYPEGMTDEIYDDVLPELQDEGTWRGETIGKRSDDTRFVEDHYLAATDDGGMVCVVRDVTQQQQLEQELDEIHDRITDAFVGLNTDWEFTYVNDRAAELIDTEDSDLAGESFWEMFSGDRSTFEAEFRTAMDTQEPISFEEYVPSLGAWFEVNAYPSTTGLSVYLRDVTEKYERRQQLKRRETALRNIYGVISDTDRTFEQKVESLLDICRDTVDTEFATLSHVDGDEYRFELVKAPDESVQAGDIVPLETTNCERAIEKGETLVLEDVDRDAPDLATRAGNAEWGIASYLGAPVVVDDDVYGTFCFYDKQPREKPFSDWEVTLTNLLSRWVGYELEREERRRQLEQSNERLEQFAYAASHDLQEPLRMVSSYLSLIEQRYADRLDEDGQEFLEFAVDGAERMRNMIDALLEYSRIETQGDPFEPVALDAVFEDALQDLKMKIAESDAEITAESLPRTHGDGGQLRQVFQNLLSNAIEYSGDNTPRVHVSAERSEGKVMISVRDEGVGIPADKTDRVFEVFQRLHARDEHSGTGIGLALVERIVERHGGEIWVDSEPGEGSTFHFTLSDEERDPER